MWINYKPYSGGEMDIKQDTLYTNISKKKESFKKEANKHRRLKRFLWTLSTLLSVGLALCANFTFTIFGVTSSTLTEIISIIVPVVTGYSILRSPETLWIMETEVRNKLSDLKEKLKMTAERDPNFDRTVFEDEYFQIMDHANNRWLEIKQNGGKAMIR